MPLLSELGYMVSGHGLPVNTSNSVSASSLLQFPAPLEENVIVPSGVLETWAPGKVRTASHVSCWPTSMGVGQELFWRLVGRPPFSVSLPELPLCLLSPA